MSVAVHAANRMMNMVTDVRESAKIHTPIDGTRDEPVRAGWDAPEQAPGEGRPSARLTSWSLVEALEWT
jgi:hypothetical protein